MKLSALTEHIRKRCLEFINPESGDTERNTYFRPHKDLPAYKELLPKDKCKPYLCCYTIKKSLYY